MLIQRKRVGMNTTACVCECVKTGARKSFRLFMLGGVFRNRHCCGEILASIEHTHDSAPSYLETRCCRCIHWCHIDECYWSDCRYTVCTLDKESKRCSYLDKSHADTIFRIEWVLKSEVIQKPDNYDETVSFENIGSWMELVHSNKVGTNRSPLIPAGCNCAKGLKDGFEACNNMRTHYGLRNLIFPEPVSPITNWKKLSILK